MDTRKTIRLIKQALTNALPGNDAHQKMAPETTLPHEEKEHKKLAAVLILLYPKNNALHVVFIKRPEYEGVHSGQVSFPGGRFEKGDGHTMETAIRETMEETGVNGNDIDVFGQMSDFYIYHSNFLVHPYVGYLDYCPEFKPDPTEVQYIIESPLDKFIDPSVKENLLVTRDQGGSIMAPCFNIDNEIIWGATAMMMSEFLEVYKTALKG